MVAGIQETVNAIQTKMERRFSERRKDLDRRLEEQRLSREKEYRTTMQDAKVYLDHLSGIYQKIVEENNPFTKKYILDANTPEVTLGIIHDSNFYLELELSLEGSDNLVISNEFRIGDLDKIQDLRRNSMKDLINLLRDRVSINSDQMAEDAKIYYAVALGFIEVSPEDLSNTRANVSRANSFLMGYKNSSPFRKLGLYRKSLEKKELVNLERKVELDYVLTPLGRAAVLPMKQKYIALANRERLFKGD